MKQHVLFTGIGGDLGLNLVEKLCRLGYQVVAVANGGRCVYQNIS